MRRFLQAADADPVVRAHHLRARTHASAAAGNRIGKYLVSEVRRRIARALADVRGSQAHDCANVFGWVTSYDRGVFLPKYETVFLKRCTKAGYRETYGPGSLLHDRGS